jgi:hypothetical protein
MAGDRPAVVGEERIERVEEDLPDATDDGQDGLT